MIPNPNLRVLTAIGGAAAVAATVVLATVVSAGPHLASRPAGSAQSSPTPNPSDPCADFKAHLAHDLGRSQAQVDKAMSDALQQTLADEVAAHRITQKQADAVQKRLQSNPTCQALSKGAGNKAPGHKARGAQIGMSLVAQALGITPAELKADLAQGMTVAQVAASKGITEDQFRSNLIGLIQPKLDAQVKAGKMTQAQEDKLLARLRTGPLPFWNAVPKTHRSPSPSPTASIT